MFRRTKESSFILSMQIKLSDRAEVYKQYLISDKGISLRFKGFGLFCQNKR